MRFFLGSTKKPDHQIRLLCAPQVGLEPTTLRLTAECSAIELLRNMESGGDLLSRTVTSQVPSALKGLTSVFGMGTGGTPSSLPPEMVSCLIPTLRSQSVSGLRHPRLLLFVPPKRNDRPFQSSLSSSVRALPDAARPDNRIDFRFKFLTFTN